MRLLSPDPVIPQIAMIFCRFREAKALLDTVTLLVEFEDDAPMFASGARLLTPMFARTELAL